ncbi:hypothetical protein PAE975_6035 (plasmid) [Pseudomonas aeruginosa]|uniref:hypothetical protein n=1 Tax=Pseudomonas aeruginosa TaxID=287 RepID=UPI001A1B2FA4|nr:hypothetical protein [Pseudomonas aeruginosa]MBH8699147.1 hypothetical protein [Pseudomonas aeruginosa]HEK3608692.1 hypothetical protein [Pseudomonas aeruginosa]
MENAKTLTQKGFVHRNGKIYRRTNESFSAFQKAFFFDRLLEKDANYFPGGQRAQEEAHEAARFLLAHEEEVLLPFLVDIQAPAAGAEASEGWEKFPVSRPLPQAVFLVHEGVLKVGTGWCCPRTGGAIKVDNTLIDSNQTAWWKYA